MYFIVMICSCILSFFIFLVLMAFLEPRAFICSFSLIFWLLKASILFWNSRF
ncbi:hypothetical protein [Campylobacter sp.]|uniref:hypothetical protein n=1 Tax=Campylobacter sp. TaxID=205 RepID=UPI002AA7B14A|nr:hypothetical protein [Campylobacter sp.]